VKRTSGPYSHGTPIQPYPKTIFHKQIRAAAAHCVLTVGFGSPIRTTKVVMNSAQTRADQNMMRWRPKRSIVGGNGYVPIANMVFMTAARS